MNADLITIVYRGPKPSKTLELPVGIVRFSDIEARATFNAGNNRSAQIHAQYVGALIGPHSHYEFADTADRQRFADWVTSFQPNESEALPTATPVIPEPDEQPVTIRPIETRLKPTSHLEDLNTFEELI